MHYYYVLDPDVLTSSYLTSADSIIRSSTVYQVYVGSRRFRGCASFQNPGTKNVLGLRVSLRVSSKLKLPFRGSSTL
jgi:hypothetical protein